MAQNKYREQIQNSVITPSDDSWSKLNKKLTDHEKSKKNKKRIFMKYAASLLFIISIGFYLLQGENELTPDEINARPEKERSSLKPPVVDAAPETFIANQTIDSAVIKNTEPGLLANNEIKYQALKNEDHEGIQNANSIKAEPNYLQTSSLTTLTKNEQHNQDEDFEVEALLKNASRNLERNIQYSNKSKISGMDLLGEIEDDLEKDSRRKLFEKVIITIKNPAELEITDRSN